MASRVLGLLVLLDVAADLADPMVPGVFSFATDRLFLDGVVQVKSASHLTPGAAEVRDVRGRFHVTITCSPHLATDEPQQWAIGDSGRR